MKDDGSQQEDVTGLFRKFGGDAAAYKEFAPADLPASANPVAVPPAKIARPAKAVLVPVPTTAPQTPATAPTAVAPASTDDSAAPSALELLFARLDGRPAVPAPVATRGLMAHWRKPT